MAKLLLSLIEELQGQPRRASAWLRQMPDAVLASEAGEILDAMKNSDLEVNAFHFSNAIGACDRCGMWQDGVGLLEKMVGMNAEPDVVCFNSAMRATEYASAWPCTLHLLDDLATTGLSSDHISINLALGATRRALRWQRAVCLWQGKSADVPQNPKILSTVSTCCESAGRWAVALNLFESSLQMHVRLDQISLNAALAAHSERWQEALQAFAAASADAYGCNTISNACGKASAWLHASSVLAGMRAVAVQPDLVSVNTLIGSFENESLWMRAVAGLQHSLGQRPSCITFSTVVSSFAKAAVWRAALQCLSRPEAESQMGYGAGVTACERGYRWRHSLQLLCRIQRRQLVAQVSFNAALAALARVGLWQAAAQMFCEINLQRPSPDEVGSTAVISSCDKRGLWPVSLSVLRRMRASAARCASITFNAVASACEKVLEWSQSLALIGHMVASYVTLQTIGCNAAIGACQKALEWRQVVNALYFMQGFSLSFTSITCNVSMKACESGRWRPALVLLQCMLIVALQPCDISYNSLLASLQIEGHWQRGIQAFSIMQSEQILPDVMTFSSVLGLCEHRFGHFCLGTLQEATSSLATRNLQTSF